jgi:hypothetical protein
MGKTVSVTGKALNPFDTAIPCGMRAETYFAGKDVYYKKR